MEGALAMSTHELQHDPTQPQEERKRRRRGGAFFKFGLAGLAILGIGAAATSAVFNANVEFNADATGAEFAFLGSHGGGEQLAIVPIPASELEDLVPNEIRTIELTLHNNGTSALDATIADVVASFTNWPAFDATISFDRLSRTTAMTIPAHSPHTFDLIVTTGAMPDLAMGGEGSIMVTVNGQAVAATIAD
ncbi:hypothetical protein ET445_09420 [Agromyces protaetiae]|uniref:Uncharacterized protein n=1 Tax=Agromyces protaetiae TaxID=2509455 RepID=A0A4P6FCD6_9MICO|nr:hypothetical protein [Agromyces protaetiae]QAY73524.1 hypothetical protein ET445_09420 [Agromyces protaetiae]